MANDARRIADLNTTTTLASTDRVVVLVNPANTANVLTISVNNFLFSIGNNMPGPFTNNVAANTGGVILKGLYYDNNGFVRIRTS